MISMAGVFAYEVLERGADFAYSKDNLLWFAKTAGWFSFLSAVVAVLFHLSRHRR